MADGFTSQVMLCWPSDRNAIALLNAKLPAKQHFVPSVEHSLSTCDGCEQGVWIGPEQLQLVDSPFVRARKLCLHCAGKVREVLKLAVREVDINPGLADARRRTA